MKFGLSFLPDAEPATKSAAEYYRDALDMAVLADQAGLASIKITEHYTDAYGGYCPDPLMFLTAVGQRTRQIRLLTGCLLPAFHHPIELACRIAQADVLSGGRMEIGFARGFLPSEFEMFGLDLERSRTRFEAVIEAIQGLFLNDAYTADTPFFKFDRVCLLPKSVQKPHPPFWGAAARSRASFAWLAEKGFNLLAAFTIQEPAHLQGQLGIYRDVFAQTHKSGTGACGKIALLIPLFLHQDDAEARRRGDRYLNRYLSVWAAASSSWNGRASADYPGYSNLQKQISAASPETMHRNKSLAFGDPAHVRDHLAWLAETFDVDQILWNVDFGAMPRDDALKSVHLLLEKVLV